MKRFLLAMLFATGVIAPGVRAADADAHASAEPSTLSKVLRLLGAERLPGARGDKAYHGGDYEEALRQYGKAAQETPAPSPLLDYNTGNALYRQKRYPEAADHYQRALKNLGTNPDGAKEYTDDDSAFAARVHHNLGNTFFRKSEEADSTALQEAIADAREALAHYKKSLQQDPGNRGSKQNLEMAQSRLQELLAKQEEKRQKNPQKDEPPKPPEPSARAKEALARALQLAQEHRYAEAKTVLDAILRSDATAASYRAHAQRLDDVMKILRGETPSDPAPRDPRATPWNPGAPGSAGSSGGRRGP